MMLTADPATLEFEVEAAGRVERPRRGLCAGRAGMAVGGLADPARRLDRLVDLPLRLLHVSPSRQTSTGDSYGWPRLPLQVCQRLAPSGGLVPVR